MKAALRDSVLPGRVEGFRIEAATAAWDGVRDMLAYTS